MTRETDHEALTLIQAAWGAWAVKQIDEIEFAARVADALEYAGMGPIGAVQVVRADNDANA